MLLHEKQKKAVNPLKRWFVDRAGRRGGKTIVKIERLLFRGLSKDVELSREFKTRSVIFLAPTQKQARTIVWEGLKARLNGVGVANESRLEMKIINELGGYTTIFVGGWENRENYRGMSNVVWIEVDETDTMRDFMVSWKEIFYPMLAETGGGAGFSGTPKKENPNLRRLEKEAEDKIDWTCNHWTSEDNPYFPKGEILKAKEEMDSNTFRQEILAEYVDDLGALFKFTALVDMFSNTITKSNEKFMTVDIADDGHDKTVFAMWQGLECYRVEQFERLNTEGIIDQIREYASQEKIPYSQIAVDAIGVGAGVASSSLLDGIIGYKSSLGAIKTDQDPVRLPNVHYTQHAPLISEYQNLRSQCLFELARLVNDHKIAVKTDDVRIKETIIEELSTYQDASKGDGKRMATKKEEVKELIGRSPDCFIAGTKVMTPTGEKNIEDLRVGDEVITPFRTTKIAYLIKKKTNNLYTINDKLTGTGNHKIPTQRGFTTIDSLTMRDYYYTYNKYNLFIWKILSSFSIKARNIGYRGLVDTFITAHTKMESSKNVLHYIDKFGKNLINKLFLKDMRFITKTETTLITNQQTLKSLKEGDILPFICENDGKKTERNNFQNSQKLVNSQKIGTNQMKERSGTVKTQNRRGKKERSRSLCVTFVEKHSKNILQKGIVIISVVIAVFKNITTKTRLILKNVTAYFAERLLVSGKMNLQNAVHTVVQQKSDGVDVYSLTLEEDNVYFANGILVGNCSDTLIMRMYFVVRDKVLPYQSEKDAEVFDKMMFQFDRNENNLANNGTR